jgi:DNA (cytosine-5)-methyltransferase 1
MDVFNYECPEQMNLFDFIGEDTSIDKKIRLIELFAGYGSQAMALKRLGADFEHYRVVEFDKHACNLYNKVHKTNFEPTDICDVKGGDLGIKEKDMYCYLLTYSFPCT